MAVASETPKSILIKLLTKLGILHYFDVIVSAEEVENGKPAPDIFIETAKRLHTPAENILVFEDSENGVESAKKAHMICIATPYLVNDPLENIFYEADILFKKGIKEFDPEHLFLHLKDRIVSQ